MLSLILLPVLLGSVLLFDIFDNGSSPDSSSDKPSEPEGPEPIQAPEGEDIFYGTHAADTITAHPSGSVIYSLEGDDTVFGGAEDDFINSGRDSDQVYAGDGNDTVNSRGGADYLDMGAGHDDAKAGDEDDTILGGDGNDTIRGHYGDDLAYGEAGDDVIYTSQGDDLVYSGDGNDVVLLSYGDDTAYGGSGDDRLTKTIGSHLIYGEQGNDVIRVPDRIRTDEEAIPVNTTDTIDGGEGNDTIIANGDDLLTGGAGEDEFQIYTQEPNEGSPGRYPTKDPEGAVTITDFNTSEDVLQITHSYPGEPPDLNDFTFQFDSTSESVQLLRGSTVMAILQGLGASDIPEIDLVLANSNEGEPLKWVP